jgi:hypothetical protein
MFAEAASVGGLEIQLVYYGGRQTIASRWMTDGRQLGPAMRRIECVGGYTQIQKVLTHTRRMHDEAPVAALVFIGDAMEESIDALCAGANELGARNIRAFLFQEGESEPVEKAFRAIARATHGAYAKFTSGSAKELGALLRAVAAYCAGGLKALEGKKEAVALLQQLK